MSAMSYLSLSLLLLLFLIGIPVHAVTYNVTVNVTISTAAPASTAVLVEEFEQLASGATPAGAQAVERNESLRVGYGASAAEERDIIAGVGYWSVGSDNDSIIWNVSSDSAEYWQVPVQIVNNTVTVTTTETVTVTETEVREAEVPAATSTIGSGRSTTAAIALVAALLLPLALLALLAVARGGGR